MSKAMEKLATIVIGLSCSGVGHCYATGAPVSAPRCDQTTNARPGMGRSFTGHVVNEDYAFAVTVPNQLTAWDGASDKAPFHGFVLFLDPQMRACIVFEIHIRVDDGDAPRRPRAATQIRLGDAWAWQELSTGGQLVNVRTTFSFRQNDQIDDGEILLITPESNRLRAQGIYDAFVRSLSFSASPNAKP
jgi:hypothetical protein